MIEPKDILFVGMGTSAVGWYRCYLPAIHMGADWVGVAGEPPGLAIQTGLVKNETARPHFDDYRVVIVQQPRGRAWFKQIKNLQERGIKVLFEVDDYLHGVRKQQGHDFAKHFAKEALKEIELCMRACDGIICSTDWLGKRYRKFNQRVYVAENGIDMARYNLTRPERPTVNIGWAGATGHITAILEWLNVVIEVMRERDHTTFVAVGQHGYADPFHKEFGEERALGVPFTLIEAYPAAMTLFDIAIAPAGKTSWYQGKSDLRWLEAGALGVPIIAEPSVYPHIEHGVNGFHARGPAEIKELLLQLVDEPETRERVGAAAKDYIRRERDMPVAVLQWLEICRAVAGDYDSESLVARS